MHEELDRLNKLSFEMAVRAEVLVGQFTSWRS